LTTPVLARDKRVCPDCGGYKSWPAVRCQFCYYKKINMELLPVEPGDPVKDAFEKIISSSRGQIS
jgi:hypothetical protein